MLCGILSRSFQIALCEFEIGFDLPAQHVRFQDFSLSTGKCPCTRNTPSLAVAAVPRIYKFLPGLRSLRLPVTVIYRKQVSGFPLLFFCCGNRFFLYIQPALLSGFRICPQILCTVFSKIMAIVSTSIPLVPPAGPDWKTMCQTVQNRKGIPAFFCFLYHAAYSVCPFSFCSCLRLPGCKPVNRNIRAVNEFSSRVSQKYLGKTGEIFHCLSIRPSYRGVISGIRCASCGHCGQTLFRTGLCLLTTGTGVLTRNHQNMRAHLCFLSVCDSRSRITPAAVSC